MSFEFKPNGSSTSWADDEVTPPTSPPVVDQPTDASGKSILDRLSGMTTEQTAISTAKATQLIEPSQFEVEVKLEESGSQVESVQAFEDLKPAVSAELLKGLYAMGFRRPSKIQARALPLLMQVPYRNFIGQSQSGTGKTGAFVLSALARINVTAGTQVIVLAPTRELAVQIMGVVKAMSQFTQITSAVAVKESVQRGSGPLGDHVIVGTPGTVQDLLRRKTISADGVSMLVIDEADHMLDKQGMGDQTIRIKRLLPQQCQVVLFSATYREDVRLFAERVVPNANMISLKREELSVDAIKQLYLDCNSEEQKYQTLCDIYGLCNIGQSIIFCERRNTADEIAKRMQSDGHKVVVLHGALEPADRDAIFNSYLAGETKVLITTNVLARGIDVLDVNLVINYDLPLDRMGKPDFETYLHRIGRTGRFGRRGISINFVHDDKSLRNNQSIESYFGKTIKRIGTEDLVTLEKELKEALKDR